MLGDGIVSFGTPVSTRPARKENASPKIVRDTPTFPSTWRAAAMNSMSPSSLWKETFTLSSAVEIPSSA